MAPPDFGRSVNPISTRGTDYAHLITTGTHGFSDLLTALMVGNFPYTGIPADCSDMRKFKILFKLLNTKDQIIFMI